ncbi:MAG: hypothetical protein M1827_001671 [Pycnora praestabilis]|nr:MAG: hypothetical protein M1827_001671 [Pycnora praestabilis]
MTESFKGKGPRCKTFSLSHSFSNNPTHQNISKRTNSTRRIDVSIRLRRAIHLNDLLLVARITRNNPTYLRNPDLGNKGNTSLHLAAELGLLDIVIHLVDAGHEDEGVSRNADGDTPLILAAAASDEDVVRVLASRFESCVNWKNKAGADALMTASRHGHPTHITLLLTHTATPHATDTSGNTALHYASAHGELKVIRTLLHANASPLARNAYSWTPIQYSSTVAAEVYFKNLVAEFERRRLDRGREERAKLGGGVRLVTSEEVVRAREAQAEAEREREMEMDGTSVGAGRVGDGGTASRERRAMTPTAGRSDGWGYAGLRARASSGD